MTIIVTEGFDLIADGADLLNRGFAVGEGGIAATASQWSTPVLDLFSTSANVINYKAPESVATEEYICVSCWRYFSDAFTSSSGWLIALTNTSATSAANAANVHAGLAFKSGLNSLDVYGDLFEETTPVVLQQGVWQHHELRVRFHATLGTIEYYVDGSKKVDLTSIDTQATAGNAWVHLSGTAGPANCYVDDLVIQTGTSIQPLLGAHRIHTLLPDGAGTNSAWTGTSTDVDDPFGASDGDSTFATSDVLNDKQDYSVGDLTQSPTTIHSVSLTSEMRKTDAGVTGATPYILSNAVEGAGVEHGVSEGYSVGVDVFELNPDGSVAWTETTVNALLIGHEITT